MNKPIRAAGKVIRLEQLVGDERNSNRWTRRGKKLLQHAIQKLGTGRGILLDQDFRVIAGNKTVQSAIAAKVRDAIVVQSDGTKLIAVQRMNLNLENDAEARQLAIADNRAGQISLAWDGAQLVRDVDDYAIDLEELGFRAGELARLHPTFEKTERQTVPESFSVLVECNDEAEQKRIYERMRAEGRKCRVLTL